MINDKHSGLTLIEILVVLFFMGLFLSMTSRLLTGVDNQKRFDETRKRMMKIRKAILGPPGAYVNGVRQFMGYASDMGGLPELNRDGQPEALWKQGDLPQWEYKGNSKSWMGWRGPYIEKPFDNVLKDGWGNPFKFIKGPSTSEGLEDGDMKIKSLGADGKEGGTGYDRDIELIIRETDYMGAVAGHINLADGNNKNVRIEIFYPSSGTETSEVIEGVDEEGYFRFEKGATGAGEKDLNIPMGVRRLVVKASGMEKELVFCVEPTGNWLGTLKLK